MDIRIIPTCVGVSMGSGEFILTGIVFTERDIC